VSRVITNQTLVMVELELRVPCFGLALAYQDALNGTAHFAASYFMATSLCRVQEKRTMREENFVPCLVLIVFLAFPRIALVLLFLFSNYLQRAYHGVILLLLGFLFLPLTTLAYAWMVNTRQPIAGINLVILIVAVVIDLGGLSRGEYHRRRQWGE
jgi:uncharacterized oligopeptide transporter (OPT) family protein